MRMRSAVLFRHAPSYILGCLTGFVLSALLFNLIAPSSVYSSDTTHSSLAAFTTPRTSSSPLSQHRSFSHLHDQLTPDDNSDHTAIPDELDMNGAAIHSNHSTIKMLNCLETLAPPNSIIVPTRTHPGVAITVLDPKLNHATSVALLRYGVDDVHLLQVMAPLLHGECGMMSSDKGPGLVVVQQADVGFLGMYAASVGCSVLMLETRQQFVQALQSTMCVYPQYADRIRLEQKMLTESSGKDGADSSDQMVRAYVGLDTEEGEYSEEDAESHFDCTQPSNVAHCTDLPATSLASLLHPTSTIYTHLTHYPNQSTRPIFFLQLSGDPHSVRSLLSATTLLSTYKLYHVLLPFRPHLLGLSLAKQLLSTMERYGYEIAEIPHIATESSFGLFQSLRSMLASSFSSLASYTRPIDYTELDEFTDRVFECGDKRHVCRVDLLFTLMNGRFVAGIVPFQENALLAGNAGGGGGGGGSAGKSTPTVPAASDPNADT